MSISSTTYYDYFYFPHNFSPIGNISPC